MLITITVVGRDRKGRLIVIIDKNKSSSSPPSLVTQSGISAWRTATVTPTLRKAKDLNSTYSLNIYQELSVHHRLHGQRYSEILCLVPHHTGST